MKENPRKADSTEQYQKQVYGLRDGVCVHITRRLQKELLEYVKAVLNPLLKGLAVIQQIRDAVIRAAGQRYARDMCCRFQAKIVPPPHRQLL